MSDEFLPAIEAIQAKIKMHLDEVVELKRAANALCRITGKDPLYPDPDMGQGAVEITRSDVFYGKPLSTAAREYLEFRKRACSADEILSGLEKGGFDFDALGWKGEHRLRSLAVSLAKNTAMFRRLPNGTFGLNAWYQDAPTPKRRTKGGAASSATPQTQEQPKAEQPSDEEALPLEASDIVRGDNEVSAEETGSVDEPTEPATAA